MWVFQIIYTPIKPLSISILSMSQQMQNFNFNHVKRPRLQNSENSNRSFKFGALCNLCKCVLQKLCIYMLNFSIIIQFYLTEKKPGLQV